LGEADGALENGGGVVAGGFVSVELSRGVTGDGSYVMRLIPADELALNDTPTSISGQ
jgi:hypothetical protein